MSRLNFIQRRQWVNPRSIILIILGNTDYYRLKSRSEWTQAYLFTSYYSSTFNNLWNIIPVKWCSIVDPSGHFNYSYYVHIHQLNVEDFVVESTTMVIFKFFYFCSFSFILKKSASNHTIQHIKLKKVVMYQAFAWYTVINF